MYVGWSQATVCVRGNEGTQAVWLVDVFFIDFGRTAEQKLVRRRVRVVGFSLMGLFSGTQNRKAYLEVSVDDEAVVHVLQAQDDFSSVETHFFLTEHAMLRQVVMEVAA